ncbi:MAG: D-alanyl-D-alanine carboxypeptidase [Oscillospiraceae bacterium]|nr:D-alanyl-D-alanine carboxypeptidase [Oscillospiraceae bacterium]
MSDKKTPGEVSAVAEFSESETTTQPKVIVPAIQLGDEIHSKYAVFYNISRDETICEKNPDTIAFPASLTKIMTSIIAIERIDPSKYDDTIIITQDIIDFLFRQNAATAGFEAKEEVKIIDLLYGVMLPSGAEASIAVANYVAGSESRFADLMNEKAKELGCNNTNFVNVTGLHDENHYTTASDMAKILTYSIKNEMFRSIFTRMMSYTTSPTNIHEEGITFSNTTYIAFSQNNFYMGFIIGGKTGFTNEACLCLATYAVIGGNDYILITMGAGEGDNKTAYHVMDAVAIYGEYT